MYRQSLQLQSTKMAEDQFLHRLGNLPVVNSAWTNASSLYQKTKEWNWLTRTTLGIAEFTVMTMAETAKPIVNKFQPQIDKVNGIACEQLARLEERFPAIAHSTDQLVEESKEACKTVLKPVTDRITAVKDFSTSAYNGVVNTGVQKVNQVKQLGTDAVSGVMVYGDVLFTKTFNNTYGQYLLQGVDGILSISEMYVDKYLPSDEDEGKENVEKTSTENPVFRSYKLSVKIRRRLYKHAVSELQVIEVRVRDLLTAASGTISLLDNVKLVKTRVTGSVSLVHERLIATWNKIVSEEINEDSQRLEDRTILLARRLASRLQTGLATLTLFVSNQPSQVIDRLKQAEKYAADVYLIFMKKTKYEEIPAWLLGQTRERIAYIQEALSLATEYLLSSPLNWLVSVSKMSGKVTLEVSEKSRQ